MSARAGLPLSSVSARWSDRRSVSRIYAAHQGSLRHPTHGQDVRRGPHVHSLLGGGAAYLSEAPDHDLGQGPFTSSSFQRSISRFCTHSKSETVTPPAFAKMSGMTNTLLAKRMGSGSGSVPDGVNRIFGEIRGRQDQLELQHVRPLLLSVGVGSGYPSPPSVSRAWKSFTKAGGVFDPMRAIRKLVWSNRMLGSSVI